jgi:hypothetical protein
MFISEVEVFNGSFIAFTFDPERQSDIHEGSASASATAPGKFDGMFVCKWNAAPRPACSCVRPPQSPPFRMLHFGVICPTQACIDSHGRDLPHQACIDSHGRDLPHQACIDSHVGVSVCWGRHYQADIHAGQRSPPFESTPPVTTKSAVGERGWYTMHS